MRIISWNMARAIPPKGAAADPWDVLAHLSPDIALLQECRPPSCPTLGGTLHFVGTSRGWGTAVWSRWPLSHSGNLPHPLNAAWEKYRAALSGYIASATVTLPDRSDLLVTSVHAYPVHVPSEYLAEFNVDAIRLPHQDEVWPGDLVWWALRNPQLIADAAVVGGDWNTARRFDQVYGPRGNAEFFARMKRAGWEETARKFYADEVQTYFKKGKGPYQLDHVFATKKVDAVVIRFEVIASAEVLAASDHAAIVVECDLEHR